MILVLFQDFLFVKRKPTYRTQVSTSEFSASWISPEHHKSDDFASLGDQETLQNVTNRNVYLGGFFVNFYFLRMRR